MKRATELASLPASCQSSSIAEYRTLEDASENDGESFRLKVDPVCRAQWLEALEVREDFLCPDDVEGLSIVEDAPGELCMLESRKETGLSTVASVVFVDQSTIDFAVVTSK